MMRSNNIEYKILNTLYVLFLGYACVNVYVADATNNTLAFWGWFNVVILVAYNIYSNIQMRAVYKK